MSRARALLLVLLVVAPPVLAVLGLPDLIDPDEGRYAWAARQMARDGLALTPYFNDEPRFAKPPPVTWLQALSMRALGQEDEELALRLPGALLALAAVYFAASAAVRIAGPWAGLIAGLCLGTSFRFVTIARLGLVDAPLLGALTGALACFLRLTTAPPKDRARLLLAAHLWLGLGVLFKGPVAVALGWSSLLLYGLWSRDRGLLAGARPGRALLALAVLALPVFAAMLLAHGPGYAQEAIGREQLSRFLSPEFGSASRRGPLYFPAILPGDILPFTPAVALALWLAWRGFAAMNEEQKKPVRLLLCWVVAVVAFFSIARYKLPHYIVPAYPALAMLAGVMLARAPSRLVALAAALPGALAVAAGATGAALYLRALGEPTWPAVAAVAAIGLSLALLVALTAMLVPARFSGRAWLAVLGCVAAVSYVLIEVAVLPGLNQRFRPERSLAEAIPAGARVGLYDLWSSSFIHYVGKKVEVVRDDGELRAFAARPGSAVLLTHLPPPPEVLALRPRDLGSGKVLTPRLVDLWRPRPLRTLVLYEE